MAETRRVEAPSSCAGLIGDNENVHAYPAKLFVLATKRILKVKFFLTPTRRRTHFLIFIFLKKPIRLGSR